MVQTKGISYLSDHEAQTAIVEIGKRMYAKNYVVSNDGNISIKVGENALWITPSGVSKGYMTPEMLIKTDLDGNVLLGSSRPSSEIKMHLRVYKENPEVLAVTHAHPPIATSFAVAGIPLDSAILPEAIVTLGSVPIAEYATPGTVGVPDSIAPYCKTHNGVLLESHGVITWGKDVFQAYHRLESLEYYATVTMNTHNIIGKAQVLDDQEVARLIGLRENFGITSGGHPRSYSSSIDNINQSDEGAKQSRFSTYFLMEEKDVHEYVREFEFFDTSSELTCKEIGDGNLNYVFRVVDEKNKKSIIVKQAGCTARISDEFKLSTDRNRIESEILILEDKLTDGLVPKVYKYDSIMNCCVMEDLSDYTIMRTALLKHEIFPHFSDDITTFLVNTLLMTSDLVLDHKEKKELVKNYINPELCEISEDLVYSEPFNNYKNRNEVFPPNAEFVAKEIYGDKSLGLEMAKLKFEFMNNAQALIHGDLHTGSIFIKQDLMKVIDPEFAFYGPMGYDIGNVIANLIFALVNGELTITDQVKKEKFTGWVIESIIEIIDLFKHKFLAAWKNHVTDCLAKEEGFDQWYLSKVITDTAGVAGLELLRRIVGLAKVKDITSISDEVLRTKAERYCLLIGKHFILNREHFLCGDDFKTLINETLGGK
ncbi:MAG: putative 5-methylthioribose kinase [Bacillales bacterium]|jgi:5-methylthioribose kinase|nr:putative 5-methylthioribose kinase [Bacillales bacterium]